jgi:hypothetical protein
LLLAVEPYIVRVEVEDWPVAPRTSDVENDGPAALPVALPNTVPAAALDREKVSAGVVVAVATDVVNRGDRLPALKEVTVPLPVEMVQVDPRVQV